MNKFLKKLPAEFVVYEDGFRATYSHGGTVTLIPNSRYNPKDRGWVVVNQDSTGAKWAQSYPSFKQTAEAIQSTN